MDEKGKVSGLRSSLGTICIVAMVVGLFSIPFVSTAVSAGIAGGALVLYLVVRLLVPKSK